MRMQLKAGDELPAIDKEIDQERIHKWARLSGDFNRLHVDPEYAGQTPFKGTIAHGPMSLAFLNELMMSCFDVGWVEGGRLLDVRFRSPIRPGDRIRIGGRVEAVHDEAGGRWAECRLSIVKSDGETAVTGLGLARIVEERP